MKIINFDDKYQFFPDSLKTHEHLPAQTYHVSFSKMEGFSLIKRDNLEVDEKMYGQHVNKSKKVIDTYRNFDRSLGVILSGDKGIGKTLFTRHLASQIISKLNMPVVIVDKPYFGVADFLGSIKDECMILFDEFEKVFSNDSDQDGPQQDSFLSLFDGLNNTKHMYVITVNSLYKLSDFMLDRTGRFHYHFRFNYPTPVEVSEYATDKFPEIKPSDLKDVVTFASKVKVTFDTLRAILFELQQGYTFTETIQDLNISKGQESAYDVALKFPDGTVYRSNGRMEVDLFSAKVKAGAYFSDLGYSRFTVDNEELQFTATGEIISEGKVTVEFKDDEGDSCEETGVSISMFPANDSKIKYSV